MFKLKEDKIRLEHLLEIAHRDKDQAVQLSVQEKDSREKAKKELEDIRLELNLQRFEVTKQKFEVGSVRQ